MSDQHDCHDVTCYRDKPHPCHAVGCARWQIEQMTPDPRDAEIATLRQAVEREQRLTEAAEAEVSNLTAENERLKADSQRYETQWRELAKIAALSDADVARLTRELAGEVQQREAFRQEVTSLRAELAEARLQNSKLLTAYANREQAELQLPKLRAELDATRAGESVIEIDEDGRVHQPIGHCCCNERLAAAESSLTALRSGLGQWIARQVEKTGECPFCRRPANDEHVYDCESRLLASLTAGQEK